MESFAESTFLTKHKQMLLIKLGLLVGIDVLFSLLAITYIFQKEVIVSSYVPAFVMTYVIIMVSVALSKMNQTIYHLLLGALLISLGLSIYFFSASWWVMVCALFFLHWRTTTYLQNKDASIEVDSGSILIFLCIASSSLLTGSMRDMGNAYIIYGLLFILFSIIITLTPIQRMLSDVKSGQGQGKMLFKPVGLWFLVIVAGAALAMFSSLASRGIYWGAEKVFLVFSLLVNPIYDQLLKLRDLIMNMFSSDAEKSTGNELEKQNIDETQTYELSQGISFSWLDEALLVLLVLFVVIYLIKKRKKSLHIPDGERNSYTMTTQNIITPLEESNKQPISYSKARDVIRLSMEKLEKEALMNGAGRHPNENVQSWFNRISLRGTEQFFTVYERVRYGQLAPDDDEVEKFTDLIDIYINELTDKED
ncbi:hypothetical protein JI667_05825 [Bacillus sp. NTK074B]|uniref:hypothetical protein n=1 Tax=Bacillus sp. NTK074B TaxID=2802174 RepID=UPI001A8F9726|nr:hypothetical protein [Bacillus sp. NTK074B]